MTHNFESPQRHDAQRCGESWSQFSANLSRLEGKERALETLHGLQETARLAAEAMRDRRPSDLIALWESEKSRHESSPARATLALFSSFELGKALLAIGEHDRGTEILETAIERALETNPLIPRDMILTTIRSAIDARLEAKELLGVIHDLDLATRFAQQAYGSTSSQLSELKFERVLAWEALRALDDPLAPDRYGDISAAIKDAHTLIIGDECGLSNERRGELLFALGERQFKYSEWKEAHATLESSLAFTSPSPRFAKTLIMLARISAYQDRPLDALRHIQSLELHPELISKDVARAIQDVRHTVTPECISDPSPDRLSDPPHLQQIKSYLETGYRLLQQGNPLAAQSSFEGAGAHITLHYHADHILWSKTHLLLAKALTDRVEQETDDAESNRRLLYEAREHALDALRIMKKSDATLADRRSALTFALYISEALDDDQQVRGLQSRLDRGDF